MELIEIHNYNGKYESVRADQIQSVVKPGSGPNDNGSLMLVTGRVIAFGHPNEATRIIERLKGVKL